MKLFKPTLFALLCLLPWCWLPAGAQEKYLEGAHYQRLAQPVPTSTDDKIEVVEVFWYGCPHCFELEPEIEKWLQTKPENVEFVRIPTTLGRSAWNLHVRTYYAAQTLGALDKIHRPLLDAIHIQKQYPKTPEEMADFVAARGVDKEAFSKALNSFEVETKVRRGQQLERSYQVTGVPMLIVNGKYLVGSLQPQAMMDVVNFLIHKESKPS